LLLVKQNQKLMHQSVTTNLVEKKDFNLQYYPKNEKGYQK